MEENRTYKIFICKASWQDRLEQIETSALEKLEAQITQRIEDVLLKVTYQQLDKVLLLLGRLDIAHQAPIKVNQNPGNISSSDFVISTDPFINRSKKMLAGEKRTNCGEEQIQCSYQMSDGTTITDWLDADTLMLVQKAASA